MIRETRETRVEVDWKPCGTGAIDVRTGIGFLDHLFEQWAFHGGFSLSLRAEGDLHVDEHHTAEDSALALGEAIDAALGGRLGIARFGWAYAPLDEALSRAVVDLVRRPFCFFRCPALPERLGRLPCEMVPHALRSLAFAGRFTLHLEVLSADNAHHALESAFKAFGLAMAAALRPSLREVSSTKGAL